MITYINTEVYEETKSIDYAKNEKYLARLSKDDCEKLYNYNIKYEPVIWLPSTIHITSEQPPQTSIKNYQQIKYLLLLINSLTPF